MIGSRNGIFLWDIEERKVVPSEKPVEIKAWMLTFHFPNVCVVGGSDWDGFKVFNIVTGKLIRHIGVGYTSRMDGVLRDYLFSFRLTLPFTTSTVTADSSLCPRLAIFT